MRLIFIIILLVLSASIIVGAQSTYNFLTKGRADSLYCSIDDCGKINISSLNISGRWPIDNNTILNWSGHLKVNFSHVNDTNLSMGGTVHGNLNVTQTTILHNLTHPREILIIINDTLIVNITQHLVTIYPH